MIKGKTSSTGLDDGIKYIEIPRGWKRILENDSIQYISPSSCCLKSYENVIEYLKTDGTCKCGLDCPFFIHHVFNFDARVQNRDASQAVGTKSSCNLCESNRLKGNRKSEQGLAASPLNQTLKHTAKKTIKPSTFDGTLTSKKVIGHSRTKLDSPKVKRSKKASSPLSDIPSPPPIPISSPVQNVPNNLGANQGPLPSFASIVSSSKFFNPGLNRGPLHPTGSLPLKTNEQNAFAFPKPISTAVTSISASVVTTQSATVPATQVLETNRSHLENLPMVNRIPAPTKSTPSPRVLVGGSANVSTVISSASFTSVPTVSNVSVPLTTAAISTVASIINTPTLPSLFSPLDGTTVSNEAAKLPLRAMSKSKPRSRPSRAKPKPKTDQKSGSKSKSTKGTNKGTPSTVSSMQPSFPIPSLTVNAVVSSPTSSYWPMPASSLAGNINQTPYQTSTFNPLSSTVSCAAANLIGIPNVNSSTNLTFAKSQLSQPAVLPQQSIVSSSIQLSQNYQGQGVRMSQSSVNSATGGPSVQATQTSLSQASGSSVDGKASTGGQVLAASINYPVVATPRIQPQAGMMYVAATPGVNVFPSNYPYVAASAQQMQTSQGAFTQAQNAKSSLAVSTMVTTSQQPMNISQVVSSEVGASQNQGKVSFQVPGMYVQGANPNQMYPVNPQSFNVGQYKGTYQLPSAMYQAPVQGGAMAFIAPSAAKGTYPGVQALATGNLGQFAYQNPYMFGIVMQPTTNQATSAAVTSTKSSPATSTAVTTSLQMIQPQTIQNPAVAAAFESFVPIAPAAGGQGPRFAQTLAHLASAYNTFPSPGIPLGSNTNQIQLAYQMMQMGSNPNATQQQQQQMASMAGLIAPDLSSKHPITQSVKQSLLTSMAAATVTTKGSTPATTKPQSVTQSTTSTITSTAQTTRENPTGMRSPYSTGNANSSLYISSAPSSSAFSPYTTASASAQSTPPAFPVSTDTMLYNQRALQSPPQNTPQLNAITSPSAVCNSSKTSYQSTSSVTGLSKTTTTTHESQVLSHFEPSNCTASKSSMMSTYSKPSEKTIVIPSDKCLGAVGTDHSEQPKIGQKTVNYGQYSSDQSQKLIVVSPNGKDAVVKKPSFEMNPQQHQTPKGDRNNISPLRTSNFPVSTEHKMKLSVENTGPFINKPCATGSVLSPTEVPSFGITEREGISVPSDSKTSTRTVGGNESVKQTKYESDANYYAANPLLGMKRSCEAIEVYPDPPESTDCDDDDRDDYCSSNEDPMERDPMHDDGSMETVRDLRQHGDNQHVEDKFLVTNQVRNPTKDMYNGGCNEVLKEQEMKNEHLGVNMKANQAFPPFRTEMLGELSIPHVRPHFDIGDVVWAQARGLPSWPGQIVDESKVGKGRADEGKKWVMWFGDHTFSQVEVDRLKTLSEGLRTLDDKARKKKYRAKKARISMEQAINEALEELDVRERLKAKQGMRAKTKKKRLR